jgi:hypothetical protein
MISALLPSAHLMVSLSLMVAWSLTLLGNFCSFLKPGKSGSVSSCFLLPIWAKNSNTQSSKQMGNGQQLLESLRVGIWTHSLWPWQKAQLANWREAPGWGPVPSVGASGQPGQWTFHPLLKHKHSQAFGPESNASENVHTSGQPSAFRQDTDCPSWQKMITLP